MELWDTCALIYWTLAPQRLSQTAWKACNDAESKGAIIVSSISIWEIGVKIRKGKLDVGSTFDEYVARLHKMNIEFVPVDAELWARNVQLPWTHTDPADRTIVATAMARGLPIVTSDQRIRSFYPLTIW